MVTKQKAEYNPEDECIAKTISYNFYMQVNHAESSLLTVNSQYWKEICQWLEYVYILQQYLCCHNNIHSDGCDSTTQNNH